MDLGGKVAVITGGASGIGRACAVAMAREGADIVIADRNPERMDAAAAEIRGLGRRVLGIRCDVSSDSDVASLAERSIAEMGRVDLLMNNAGVVLGGPVEKIEMADWEWIIGINLLGPIRGVRYFLPHLLERGSGYIVNTASFAGLVAHNPLTIPYDTTKHGIVGLSAGLALYLKPKGIGVSVVCPGYIHTNLSESYRFRGMAAGGAGRARVPDQTTDTAGLAAKVVAAVQAERFMILSQPEHRDVVVRRWTDIDRHIDRQIEVLSTQPGEQ